MHIPNDNVKIIEGSIVQHDKMNNRVYIMKVNKHDYINIIEKVEKIAEEKGYTKIIAKVPLSGSKFFIENDYIIEAIIPDLYNGNEDGVFVAKYFSMDRETEEFKQTSDNILEEVHNKGKKAGKDILPEGFIYKKAQKEDASVISIFYKNIFKTYPFPIYNEKYVLKTMSDNVEYFTIWKDEKIISSASIEFDYEYHNAEMTDFGTHPNYRGNGFARFLLDNMEESTRKNRINTVYSIARSKSYGMNYVFFQNGYIFAGKLINNTNIYGDIESMNVWYKSPI